MKPIEVGCWAVIYKPFPCCSKYSHYFGLPFLVTGMHEATVFARCPFCKSSMHNSTCITGQFNNDFDGAPLHICKRIDPPSDSATLTRELETVL